MTPSTPRSTRGTRSVKAYANVGLETEVMSAPPERLISLLFRGALTAIAQARFHMQAQRIAERGAALSKAIDIVDSGLKASINIEQGGDVARHLTAAYELVIRDLLQANLHSDETKLSSAERLLSDLADAWRTAADPSFGQTCAQ
ncbi:flagellar export chaperone FliS [Alcaligenaceae bacterium CGII-47]|nr:flagellar export chaperone FliS [Alcaligenaceae bacterium CGII-47]